MKKILLTFAVFFVAIMNAAFAEEFPVAELGNCASETECRAYCDSSDNLEACITYGEKSLHSTCPFDYYPSPLKEQLINLIDRKDKNCGTVEYDIAGTAQGEWFYGGAGNYMRGDWFNHLFLGYSNRIPEAAVISIGGVVSEPLKWMFAPQSSGTKNVGFRHIKDSSIFCYENDRYGEYKNSEKGPTGRILIQLVNSSSLKIELQSGTCSGAYAFVNATVYER